MHAVQTRTCFLTPATTARTRFKFGFHRRRRVLFAWLITFPKCGALPQNSHFSAIFLPASIFIWAWISCSNCHKTKLLILADPPSPAKYAFLHPGWFFGTRLLRLLVGASLASLMTLQGWQPPLGSATPISLLFFRTGFESAPRTSNSSNRIEMTRFVLKKKHLLAARTIVDLVPHT